MVLQVPWQAYHSAKGGWDHDIYCKAVTVSEAGQDPYLTSNLGLNLSYPYPAIFLKIYKPLCNDNPKFYIYSHFIALASVVALLVGLLKWDLMITLAWVFFGYNAAASNYHTGNVGAFEALFFALFLVLFVKMRRGASLFLVPASFLKIVPAVMIGPALFADKGAWKRQVQESIFFVTGLFTLIAMNYLYSVDLFWSFWRQALGLNVGQHSPIREMDANPSNPAVLIFFQNLGHKLFADHWVYFFLLCLFALAAFSYWVWKKVLRHEQDRLIRLCWAVLILFLWLPRLKPYSLVIASMVMVPLVQRLGRRFALLLLLLTVFHRTFNGDKADPWIDFLANNTMIYVYFIVLVLLVKKSTGPLRASAEQNG